MSILLFVPTRNGETESQKLVEQIARQTNRSFSMLVIDSASEDNTADVWHRAGAEVVGIPVSSFNHGATRQLALTHCPDADIIIYMTQDALLASPDSIQNILQPFENAEVGAVCGRQLPHVDASPLAAHARLFNYTAESSIKSKADISRLGIKTAFISNSFAAYRRTALMDVGGFPSDVIFGEDTYVAAKMLQAGWKIAYCAEAVCYHSHNYSLVEEFRRYFDIGVFHSREKWYINLLGRAEGEGRRFICSELAYLCRHSFWLIPSAFVRIVLKYAGYKLGQKEAGMRPDFKRKLSMNAGYWKSHE